MSEFTEKKDILIAEDDEDDKYVFELAMKQMTFSYSIRHAENGDALFILLKDKVPYILFLDIGMPCKDGMACILEIRKHRRYDKLPIIVFTSHLAKKIVQDCYRNGANLFLAKTHNFVNLVDKLNKIFAIDWANYLHFPPQNQFMLS